MASRPLQSGDIGLFKMVPSRWVNYLNLFDGVNFLTVFAHGRFRDVLGDEVGYAFYALCR